MNRAALLLTFVMLATILPACTSTEKRYVPSDPVKLGLIPKESRVVAETNIGLDPLLFVAPEDGTLYFFANDALLATIGVQKGQRVELNAPAPGTTDTVISINGKAEFKAPSRAAHNRLYFAPAAKPILTSLDA